MGRTNVWVCAAAAMLTALASQAGPPAASGPAKMYDLSRMTGLEKSSVSPAEWEMLAANGFVVAQEQFKQIFSAYIDPPMPVFITTDSVWHTYHVLLEEGVRQLEDIQARRLARFARLLVDALAKRGKADLLDYYASVGLGLQDPAYAQSLPKDSPAAATIAQIAQLGSRIETPIGFPIVGEQFRPKSFYVKTPALRTYFTARQWYSQVLFRLRHKGETQLALELALLIEADQALRELYAKLNGFYDTLLARPTDGDASQYLQAARKILVADLTPAAVAKNIDALGRQLGGQLALPKVNDLWLTPEQYVNFPSETRGFRLLPSRELPCAALFHNTTAPKIPGRMFPTGLDFLAASPELRSRAAQRAIEAQETPAVARAILSASCPPLPDSLYGQAMKALALLQEPLPAAAPRALRTAAWADKQLATQLAAWAEQRHTWALHVKLSETDFGLTEPPPPGLVEPYPKFYEGIAKLCRATAQALGPVLAEPVPAEVVARDLLLCVAAYRRSASAETQPATTKDSEDACRIATLWEFFEKSGWVGMMMPKRLPPGKDEAPAIVNRIEQIAQRCLAGEHDRDIIHLESFADVARPAVVEPLEKLAGACDRLRDIARKQLAGQSVSDDDRQFILGYGSLLGDLHFYESNAADNPRDDFPMITPVFGNLTPPGEMLYAGVARPLALFVLVEVNGAPVLHRGAVLSYRELRRPLSQPLDDSAWVETVITANPPPPEPFTASFQVNPPPVGDGR